MHICKTSYKNGRIESWFFLIFKHNGLLLYTSPVNSTGRPSFAAFIASNFPSSLALILCADQREEAPFKLKAIKKLGSSKKIITHICAYIYIYVCVCVCVNKSMQQNLSSKVFGKVEFFTWQYIDSCRRAKSGFVSKSKDLSYCIDERIWSWCW